jgi:hypothetical protein
MGVWPEQALSHLKASSMSVVRKSQCGSTGTPADRHHARRFKPGEQLLRKQKAMTRVSCQKPFLSPPHSPYFWVRNHSVSPRLDPLPGCYMKSRDIAASIIANLDNFEDENMEN